MKKSLFGKSIFIAIMETLAASSFIVMVVFVSAFILNFIFTINYNKQGINDVSVDSSRSLGENTALTSFANKIPPTVISNDNAYIIDKSEEHTENWNQVCKDSSKCKVNEINSSRSNFYSVIAKIPFTFTNNNTNKIQSYYAFSGNEIFTDLYAKRYGISTTEYKGYFDEKTRKGSQTHTVGGSNGVSKNTADVLFIPAPFRTDISSNVKGSDSSSNWLMTYDYANTNNGIWETYKYSGDSEKLLITKGSLKSKYRVTLSVFARDWRLNNAKDSGPNFNPRYFINGDEIKCNAIKVMDKTLDKNCQVQIEVSGSNSYSVTPVISTPRYLYTIGILKIEDISVPGVPNVTSVSPASL